MLKTLFYLPLALLLLCFVESCNTTETMYSTKEILVTSEGGDKLAKKENIAFVRGTPSGTIIKIEPDSVKQTMDGIGSSFTESSAFVLAHLDPGDRGEVMEKLFGVYGANFSLCRTHIGACDFCVEGRYSYADKKEIQSWHLSVSNLIRQGSQQISTPELSMKVMTCCP